MLFVCAGLLTLGGYGRVAGQASTDRFADIYDFISLSMDAGEKGRLLEAVALADSARNLAEAMDDAPDSIMAAVYNHSGFCAVAVVNIAESQSYLERALSYQQRSGAGEDSLLGAIYSNLGGLYALSGDFRDAEQYCRRALTIQERLFGPKHLDVMNTLHFLVGVYWEFDRYPEALEICNRVIPILTEKLGPDDPLVGRGLSDLAEVYDEMGRYREADSVLHLSLAIIKKAYGPDHPMIAVVLAEIASLAYTEDRYKDAETSCRQAIAVCEVRENVKSEVLPQCLSLLGAINMKTGRLMEAERYLKRALVSMEQIYGPDHIKIAFNLSGLGKLYKELGDYEQATQCYERALSLTVKATGHDDESVAAILRLMAEMCINRHDYDIAAILLNDAISIFDKVFGEGSPYAALCYYNLGIACAKSEQYLEAEQYFLRSLAIEEEVFGPDLPRYVLRFGRLSEVYLCQGRFAEADSTLARALRLADKYPEVTCADMSTTLSNLVRLHAGRGEYSAAAKYARRDIEMCSRIANRIFSFASESQRLRWMKLHPAINPVVIDMAVKSNDRQCLESALDMVLAGKAVVIDATMADRESAYCTEDSSLARALETHSQLCTQIANVVLSGIQGLSPKEHGESIRRLYNTQDSIEGEISQSCALFHDRLAVRAVNSKAVVANLRDDGVLWEFVEYQPNDCKSGGRDDATQAMKRYAAFSLDNEENLALVDLGESAEIDSLIREVHSLLFSSIPSIYSATIPAAETKLREVAAKLYARVFAPLEAHLNGRSKIFVCPDGLLGLLPLEILPMGDSSYVIEKYRISYLSSGRDLLRYNDQRPKELSGTVVVFADPDFEKLNAPSANAVDREIVPSEPIPYDPTQPFRGIAGCLEVPFRRLRYSREEGEMVAGRFRLTTSCKVREYYDEQAGEDSLKGMTSPARVMHLATHGYFCPEGTNSVSGYENPLLRSGLILAGANRTISQNVELDLSAEDGVLTAFEVSGLNLMGTELVTLSACESGVGDVVSGEGLFGLRRAFQCAGAQSVLMSLWNVPDRETKILMDGFYEHWLGGLPKSDALRESALELLRASRASRGSGHPILWGGFILAGNPN